MSSRSWRSTECLIWKEKKTNAAGRRRIRALGWQCVRGRREGGGVGRELVREGE